MKPARSLKSPNSYCHRFYRELSGPDTLVSSYYKHRETDLHIMAGGDVTGLAAELALGCRLQVEHYIESRPEFAAALVPLDLDPLAPRIIQDMLGAAQLAGVGPMAAVAGAIAEHVGRGVLAAGYAEVIVENGGDIFLHLHQAPTIGVFAGQSSLSGRVGIRIAADRLPAGICTSSGTVGHSLSFGEADSVTVVADSTSVADAVATHLGNVVGKREGGQAGLDQALADGGALAEIRGVLVICGELLGAVGEIELVPLP